MQQEKTFIIAEAGINHNGSVAFAKQLIDVAAESGADAVKFQTYNTDEVLLADVPLIDYQTDNIEAADSQYEMIKALELTQEEFIILKAYCDKKNILFLSTPFDLGSLEFLVHETNIPYVKIASNEITNAELLLASAFTKRPIILSTGMSDLNDIRSALSVLAFGYMNQPGVIANKASFEQAYQSLVGQQVLKEKVCILHCTSEYPAPYKHVNLNVLATLSAEFGLKIGYSDHTLGVEVSVAAVALGARIIEKHFTIDRTLKGPDHQASLEPDELKSLVSSIRHVEQALGGSVKQPTENELKNITFMRRSLVVRCDVKAGEVFTVQNLTVKQPATGISAMDYWDYVGKKATKNYKKNEVIF